jgi:hypothetical protein
MRTYSAFASFLEHLADPQLTETGIVRWACPVPYFGQISSATIATVGLNPSIREFADASGDELQGSERRFPTLSSLTLGSWTAADASHVVAIADACSGYFARNPYQRWFNVLDGVLRPAGYSYYSDLRSACHLDLVPFATHSRWGALTPRQRHQLLMMASRHLGSILIQTSIRLLILNGRSVIRHVSSISDAVFDITPINKWRLRTGRRTVPGLAYAGTATQVGGVTLDAPLRIIGFNHNLQSSFGVTRQVSQAIGQWASSMVSELD